MKMVRLVNMPWRRVPGKSRHRDHHGLLDSTWPAEVAAEYGGAHHAKQVKEITFPLDLNGMTCLHDLRKRPVSLYFLSCENELIVNVEQHKQAANDERPLRQQTKRPGKRHAAKKSEKQRRITKRRQQACGVAHDEYEKNDEMSSMLPQMVRAEKRTDHQHRRACGSDQVCRKRAQSEEHCIHQRRSRELTLHINPARDDEERTEQRQK